MEPVIPAVAFYAIGASVVMHVAWNLAARRADPRSFFLWWALLGYLVLVGPWSVVALVHAVDWSPRLVGLLLLSAAAETLYFIGLGVAYRHAPVPLVYPIVRSSPLLVALWMALLFREQLPLLGWAGILVSVAGVLALSLTGRDGEPARAIPWALAAALGTSIYSISNKFAVDALPSYPVVLGWAALALAPAWIGLTLQHRRLTGRLIPPVRPRALSIILAGLFIGNAYSLIIHAMRFMPAAYAIAFTNAGIVLAGAIAMSVYGERERWRTRLAALLVICVGLTLIAFR
jgi:phosphonate utilization associated putative membrane protein